MRRVFPDSPELTAALTRIEALEERVGDDTKLTGANQRIIADVLRKAGEKHTEEMSRSLAPLVVSSMREEIKNSSDDMVSALYPIMGRLVASYVRGTFVELTEKINKALEENFSLKRWKIRLKARMSGRPEAELLLSEARPFSLDDLFLIHRKSGLLIARAEEGSPNTPDAELISAMLTAIMSFVEDAFQESEDSTLRAISFGDSRLLIRTTPTLVMTAKITGLQPGDFEAAFDEAMISVARNWGQSLVNFDGATPLPEKAGLVEALGAIARSLPAPGLSNSATPEDPDTTPPAPGHSTPMRIGIGAIILLIFGLVIFWLTGESREEQRLGEITAILQADETLRRFPLRPLAEDGRLVVRGWLPDRAAFDHLKGTLAPLTNNPALAFDVFVPGES